MAATNADPACTYLEAARSRVVVYDGGAGTWLQQQGLTADDFGASADVNAAVAAAHREGIVTGASLLVTGAAFEEAVAVLAGQAGATWWLPEDEIASAPTSV